MVLGAAFGPDEKTVVAGSADRSVRDYRTADGHLLWTAQFHSDWVTAVAVSPDGKFVASAGKDRTVKVVEAETGKLYTTYNGHRRQYAPHAGQFEVYGVAFDPSGTAFSAGGGSAVRVWNPVKARDESGSAADMEERFASAGHSRYFDFPAGKPVFRLVAAGGQIFTAGGDGKLRQHDAANGKLIREYPAHADWVYALAVHVPSGRVATAGFDGEVRLWDSKEGKEVGRFVAAPGAAK